MKRKLKRALGIVIEKILYVYCIIFHRMKIEGRENIPMDEPVIFCGNHRTFLDPVLIKVTAKRNCHFLAKGTLYRNKFLAFLGWVFETIPVLRDSKDINAIKQSLRYLKNGECIALFPEGTRNGLAKGEKVKDGAAFFALRTGAKIVPVGISGKTGPFSKAIIRYGKPLDYSNYDKNDEEALDKITEDLMEKILELTK